MLGSCLFGFFYEVMSRDFMVIFVFVVDFSDLRIVLDENDKINGVNSIIEELCVKFVKV